MNKKRIILSLGIEGILITTLIVLSEFFSNTFSSVLTFPFQQIAYLIKLLAGTGKIGNAVALLIFTLLSILPMLYIFINKNNKFDLYIFISLIFTCLCIGVGLYALINTQAFVNPLFEDNDSALPVYKLMAGMIIWLGIGISVIIILIRNIQIKSIKSIITIVKVVLFIFILIFFIDVCKTSSEFIISIIKYQFNLDFFILLLNLLFSILRFVFYIKVFNEIYKLFDLYQKDNLPQDINLIVNKISKLIILTIIISLSTFGILNFIKFILASKLNSVVINLSFAMIENGIMLLLLLITKLIERNNKLSEDNKLFI